ncbi:MAG: hypothetical protein NT175_09000 [Bacteroidetes bacterium]|nr:hypothetical protein [Bacteroidota bacterium]
MKATNLIMILGFLMIVNLSYSDIPPATFILEEEAYIDDIPFNTELIAKKVMSKPGADKFTLEEEVYIDDIPFDTEKIVKELYREENLVKCSPIDKKCYYMLH